ncbi:hypothetical protein PHYSODRAFT_343000 [Phytophthora sojae]|uniref:Uncharacterized protein n=1 Tax=Phytophthora sojae (strain P6497) TaxID=1094619 RepID=G4ZIS0_PHYSP|nr:hypothetical protein PHYSODRAFT_331989 [Phytophthora sojae]XP_009539791.1 hypothetical protein PHYSODRAFT_343000 [Phytophthora sojae]EGZ04815.1 hypothetical protein PHYSODRAFT_343000 [Phytophthora sojae]EGZ18134.1 hypothetical protein PHYSODRAFT_331989 [Phytophthora sojae]|eukprot:XP_009527192.1 hypothetical protein PHYSODRAFT_331989 [Phytophthora sojae]
MSSVTGGPGRRTQASGTVVVDVTNVTDDEESETAVTDGDTPQMLDEGDCGAIGCTTEVQYLEGTALDERRSGERAAESPGHSRICQLGERRADKRAGEHGEDADATADVPAGGDRVTSDGQYGVKSEKTHVQTRSVGIRPAQRLGQDKRTRFMVVIQGHTTVDSSRLRSGSAARKAAMTALTPTQAKTARSGKSRRVPRRPAKKLSIPDGDEDTEDGFDERHKGADDGDQDSPSDEQEETAASRPGPVSEQEPVPARNEETGEEAPTQTPQASDEQGGRSGDSDAPAPTMDIAVIANALQQLTTAVAGLQAREAARGDDGGHGHDAGDRGGGQPQQPAASVATGASQRGRARGVTTDSTSATPATSTRTVARVPTPTMEAAPVVVQTMSPEIAAMAAAVQQLTTMVAQSQPTAMSGGT